MKAIDGLVVVCKDCRRRRNGPAQKSRKLVEALKVLLRGLARRPRIVRSGCLGLCPTGATAVAVAVGREPVRLAAVQGTQDGQALARTVEAANR